MVQSLQNIEEEEVNSFVPPSKSKLFKEQLEADKERTAEVYQTYQKDVQRLKNVVDENYLKLLDKGMISATTKNAVKIHVDVEGLGPTFVIRLSLTNEGQEAMIGLCISLNFDSSIYKLSDPLPEIGCLLPFRVYKTSFMVKNTSVVGANENVKISVFQKGKSTPLAGAIIAMPISEIPVQ